METDLRSGWASNVEREVYKRLTSESTGHDPWHAFRVRNLAICIAQIIGADVEVVCAAALLHDVGHASGRVDHAKRGAVVATDLLMRCGFPAHKIAAVTSCIERHHWLPDRAGDPRLPPLEYKAFADADRLDALGAIGIARTFAFGGAHGRPIWNPEPDHTTVVGSYGISSIHHFHDKLLRLPRDMYTEPGRQIAARRVVIMEEYLRSFHAQWDGRDLSAAAPPAGASLSSFAKRSVKICNRFGRILTAIFHPDPIG